MNVSVEDKVFSELPELCIQPHECTPTFSSLFSVFPANTLANRGVDATAAKPPAPRSVTCSFKIVGGTFSPRNAIRREKLMRYRAKKQRRRSGNKVLYACRSEAARRRKRQPGGRFTSVAVPPL